MQAATAFTDRHNQVAVIMYRNICREYRLDIPKYRLEIPQKVLDNKKSKILWDFQTQTDRY